MDHAAFRGGFRYHVSMQILNQYSFLIFSLAGLAALAVLLKRAGRGRVRLATLVVAAVLLGASWLVLRPAATPAANVGQVRDQIGQGVPVLLELQSPY